MLPVDCPPEAIARRDFVHAVLAADWACYNRISDRVDLPRLTRAIEAFPEGFRLWLDEAGMPVGYTGWHPISGEVFSAMESCPGTIAGLDFIQPVPFPSGVFDGSGIYVYLFNYSVVPALRGSILSRSMMQRFAADIACVPQACLSAVTVSADGARIASRFGLEYRGDMTVCGEQSGQVFTTAFKPRPTQKPARV